MNIASPRLLEMTGGLMIGRRDSAVVEGTLRSVREHDLEHTLMTADEIRAKWPAFNVSDDDVGVWDQSSGYLTPEACIETLVNRAVAHGAELRCGSTVRDWREEDGEFVVSLEEGTEFRAKRGESVQGAKRRAEKACLLHINVRRLFCSSQECSLWADGLLRCTAKLSRTSFA